MAVGSSVADAYGARALVVGLVGATRLSGELLTSIVNGFLGQTMEGVTVGSTTAVANGALSAFGGLGVSGALGGAGWGLGGSRISGWDILPVVGSALAWQSLANCGG